jgi:hypothetical protein
VLHFGDEIGAIQKRFAAPAETTAEESTSQSQTVEKQPSPAKIARKGPPPPTVQTASPTPQPAAKAAQHDQEPKQRDSQYGRSLFRSMFDSGETSDTVMKEREARARVQSQEKRQKGGPQHRRSDSDLDSRPPSQPTKTEEQSPTTTSQRLAEAPPYQHQHQQQQQQPQQQPPASVAQPTHWLPAATATAAASTTPGGPYAGPHTAPSQYAMDTTQAGFARAETCDSAKEVAHTTNAPSPRGSNPPTPVKAVQPNTAMLSPPLARRASAQTSDLGPMGFSSQTHDAQAGHRSTSMPSSAPATGILTEAQKRYQSDQQILTYQHFHNLATKDKPNPRQAQPVFAGRHQYHQQEQPHDQQHAQQQQQQLDEHHHSQLRPQPQQRQHLSSTPLSLAQQPTRSSPARKLSRTTTGGFRAANVEYEENV